MGMVMELRTVFDTDLMRRMEMGFLPVKRTGIWTLKSQHFLTQQWSSLWALEDWQW